MLTTLLLLFRLAILPLLIMAVVYCFRNRVVGDRRQRYAAMAGLGVALAGIGAVLFQATSSHPGQTPLMFSFSIFQVMCAGAMIWASGYAGILIGDKQGGYWVKQNTRWPPAVLACFAGAGLSFLFSALFFRALGEPLAPGQIPSTPAEWRIYLLKIHAHSFGEEVVFRGWCLAYLCTLGGRFRLGFWSANLLTAAIFAVQHEGGIYQILTAFWSGLILGKIFKRYGLFAAAFTHLLLNLLVLVFPFLT